MQRTKFNCVKANGSCLQRSFAHTEIFCSASSYKADRVCQRFVFHVYKAAKRRSSAFEALALSSGTLENRALSDLNSNSQYLMVHCSA